MLTYLLGLTFVSKGISITIKDKGIIVDTGSIEMVEYYRWQELSRGYGRYEKESRVMGYVWSGICIWGLAIGSTYTILAGTIFGVQAWDLFRLAKIYKERKERTQDHMKEFLLNGEK